MASFRRFFRAIGIFDIREIQQLRRQPDKLQDQISGQIAIAILLMGLLPGAGAFFKDRLRADSQPQSLARLRRRNASVAGARRRWVGGPLPTD